MRLLELVAGPATRPDAVAIMRAFADRRLGKSVVDCKDTPGFIANRIGTFWIEVATREAIDLGLTVEEADAVAGKPMGFPKTGIFGLMDLVGIDLGPHIAASMLSTLPAGDAYRAIHRDEPLVEKMIAAGLTGRKGKGGFYRMETSGARRTKLAIDLGDRRVPAEREAAAREPRRVEERRPARARRARRQGRPLRLADAVADAGLRRLAGAGDRRRPFLVDEAMRSGYGWERGRSS